MIQKNLIIILGTEPRILCSEVIRKNNSSMTQLNGYYTENDFPVYHPLSHNPISVLLKMVQNCMVGLILILQ